ncbi:fused (3R)-hydroxyacyl-ACP dehydratase subunits HadA/HadB [Nocardia amikacinitolerans]|uniref:fused (3R)-hydroxyacyl-ACP dehydratase subunits HadA/HadB n=2 Tax=Nocardia amikacinitolerans TaxID=756689 RepID=UPI0020A2D6E6|nr:fused (3R)-hydroxyacyl-ACP dehydratase subunits HadA/HadB [Nocardia amikacinitolerans]
MLMLQRTLREPAAARSKGMTLHIDAPSAAEQAAALVGRHFRLADHYEVGREKIREFAQAVQDYHPAHWSEDAAASLGYAGLVAPLTFPAIVWLQMQRTLFETELTGYDVSQVLHTEQRVRVHRPIVAGDELVSECTFESFRQFGEMDLLVIRNLLSDGAGRPLQTTSSTVVAQTGVELDGDLAAAVAGVMMSGHGLGVRGGAARQHCAARLTERAAAAPDALDDSDRRGPIRFEELRVGDELPAHEVALSRGDLVNYAGVSGDTNPIHFSDEVAGVVGLPDVVAHGLLTMGLGAGYLTSWLGDPGAVVDYGVRFAGFAPVPADRNSTIEFSGRVKELDTARRAATVRVGATCGARKLFGRGSARVLLT